MKKHLLWFYNNELIYVAIAMLGGAILAQSYNMDRLPLIISAYVFLRVGKMIEESTHDCSKKHHIVEKL